MTSLETLPLEIHEQIFAYLVPRQRHKNLACLDPDYRNAKERQDIYNIRLTCRRLRTAALQTFVWILEDLPTKCQEGTLRKLAALLELPDISSRLTYLTLSPYHLFTDCYTHHLRVIADIQRVEFHARCAWLRDSLLETLVAIIRLAPKIRHLVCVIACLSLRYDDGGEDAWVGTVYSEAIDPMHVSSTPQPSNGLFEHLSAFYLRHLPGGSFACVDQLYRLSKPFSEIPSCQQGSSPCISSPVTTKPKARLLISSLRASLL